MFTLTIAFCLARELPTLNSCRAETLALWFATEEACVNHVTELSSPEFVLVDARCDNWESFSNLDDEPL